MKRVIHVNRAHIAANAKDGGKRPVYTIKEGRRTIYAHGVEIEGKMRLIDPRTTPPLKCGARAWIETAPDAVVTYLDPCTFKEATTA
jgi:hypothetical protein